MKPIEFKEQNRILSKPDSMTEEECSSLPVFTNGNECISLWQLSEEELQKIQETKCIWLGVVSGITQPPVFLSVDSPFIQQKNNGKWKIYIIEEDGEITHVIAENEDQARSCYLVEIAEGKVDSIREATLEEIKKTEIQCADEMKMPTLMDYHLNYDGDTAQVICSTIYTD